MAQTVAGARRVAAARQGITEAEYLAHLAAGEKWCTPCKAWLPRSEFGPDASRHDGRATRCRGHRAVRLAPGPSIPERRAAAARGEHWCRGCEGWLPSDQVRAGVCRVHANQYARERYAVTDGAGRRGRAAARRRHVGEIHTRDRETIYETTDGLCAYSCGRPATSLDHVIPVALGGQSIPGNVVPACGPCNSSKRDNDPWPWIARMAPEALDMIVPGLLYDGAVLDLAG